MFIRQFDHQLENTLEDASLYPQILVQPRNTQKAAQIMIIHAWGRIIGQLALLIDNWGVY